MSDAKIDTSFVPQKVLAAIEDAGFIITGTRVVKPKEGQPAVPPEVDFGRGVYSVQFAIPANEREDKTLSRVQERIGALTRTERMFAPSKPAVGNKAAKNETKPANG